VGEVLPWWNPPGRPHPGKPGGATLFFVAIWLVVGIPELRAQHQESVDERLLRWVYAHEGPVMSGTMRVADRTSYPAFYGTPVVMWGIALLSNESDHREAAWRLSLALAATYGSVKVLKAAFGRERPFQVMDDIDHRNPGAPSVAPDPLSEYSFPSGHASLSFAIATSLSLSYPEWYVYVPAVGWAGAVSLSRVWHGVHYPSDVLIGAALGSALGAGIHLLGHRVVPTFISPAPGSGGAPLVVFSIPIGW
jgi:membrane-associated phospholipid phosphatase